MEAAVGAILTEQRRIDILVNCAGIQRRHPSAQFPHDDWDEVSACKFQQ